MLDLNMPKMDGREALREIKADPSLRRIPIVVMTTSKAEEDIYRTYDLGVNSFITKPVTFEGLVDVMRTLGSVLDRDRRASGRAIGARTAIMNNEPAEDPARR